ncbi:MAG: FAD-dependent monooxygenase [Ornithinimicrobium sp.]|uniref:FAD-dependent monooxygenase n=1 Tax=Ornithinimicrobium sp. TaxID=1977084 RepID=UPI0026DEFC53|nr:FAD-dependent monooxygenase [Ornithinimicrobium sp.]MDO5738690.1 FAD-dependent monooxygenase [Ornithinimicrobium sp.]
MAMVDPDPALISSAATERVIVIGAGPVGQTTALLLARYGIPVILLDARPARDLVGSRAICQQRDVLDIWDWCGAGQIVQEGLTWTRARTFYRDHDLFCVDLPDPGASPLPPFVNIAQPRTEQILDALLEASPLVDLRWGHEAVELQTIDEGVEIVARTTHGEVRIGGSYAVAAAGARGSTVRSQLDITFGGRTFEDTFLICDVRAELPGWERERRFYFDPEWNRGRQVLIHPCPDSIYRIDWQLAADHDPREVLAPESLRQRITDVIGDRPFEVVWSSIYHFHARIASAFRAERVFLAGDMAHLVAPFGARGLNSGVGDADNLAWKLAAVLQGWAPQTLLDSYEPERLAAARENLEVTSATMNFLVPPDEAAWARRHALLEQSVQDVAAREQVDSGRLCEAFWYVDSPLTTADPSRAWPGRPRRGETPAPVPGVSLPDAPVTTAEGPSRLRLLIRGQVTLLSDEEERGDAALAALTSALPPGTPLRHLDLSRLDGAGAVQAGLDWQPGDLWLVRPDGHTAARVSDASTQIATDALVAAALRMLGFSVGQGPLHSAQVETVGAQRPAGGSTVDSPP